MKEITIYDKYLGFIKVDVSALNSMQLVMFAVALEWDSGIASSEVSDYTDISRQITSRCLVKLNKTGYVKKVRLDDLTDEIREYVSLYKINNRIKSYYFPTKRGIRYIKYILEKNNLGILLKKIPDEDELMV